MGETGHNYDRKLNPKEKRVLREKLARAVETKEKVEVVVRGGLTHTGILIRGCPIYGTQRLCLFKNNGKSEIIPLKTNKIISISFISTDAASF